MVNTYIKTLIYFSLLLLLNQLTLADAPNVKEKRNTGEFLGKAAKNLEKLNKLNNPVVTNLYQTLFDVKYNRHEKIKVDGKSIPGCINDTGQKFNRDIYSKSHYLVDLFGNHLRSTLHCHENAPIHKKITAYKTIKDAFHLYEQMKRREDESNNDINKKNDFNDKYPNDTPVRKKYDLIKNLVNQTTPNCDMAEFFKVGEEIDQIDATEDRSDYRENITFDTDNIKHTSIFSDNDIKSYLDSRAILTGASAYEKDPHAHMIAFYGHGPKEFKESSKLDPKSSAAKLQESMSQGGDCSVNLRIDTEYENHKNFYLRQNRDTTTEKKPDTIKEIQNIIHCHHDVGRGSPEFKELKIITDLMSEFNTNSSNKGDNNSDQKDTKKVQQLLQDSHFKKSTESLSQLIDKIDSETGILEKIDKDTLIYYLQVTSEKINKDRKDKIITPQMLLASFLNDEETFTLISSKGQQNDSGDEQENPEKKIEKSSKGTLEILNVFFQEEPSTIEENTEVFYAITDEDKIKFEKEGDKYLMKNQISNTESDNEQSSETSFTLAQAKEKFGDQLFSPPIVKPEILSEIYEKYKLPEVTNKNNKIPNKKWNPPTVITSWPDNLKEVELEKKADKSKEKFQVFQNSTEYNLNNSSFIRTKNINNKLMATKIGTFEPDENIEFPSDCKQDNIKEFFKKHYESYKSQNKTSNQENYQLKINENEKMKTADVTLETLTEPEDNIEITIVYLEIIKNLKDKLVVCNIPGNSERFKVSQSEDTLTISLFDDPKNTFDIIIPLDEIKN